MMENIAYAVWDGLTDGKLLAGAIIGVILTCLMLGFVFLNGMTFGQRCAEEHPKYSAAWERCVDDLAGVTANDD